VVSIAQKIPSARLPFLTTCW